MYIFEFLRDAVYRVCRKRKKKTWLEELFPELEEEINFPHSGNPNANNLTIALRELGLSEIWIRRFMEKHRSKIYKKEYYDFLLSIGKRHVLLKDKTTAETSLIFSAISLIISLVAILK
jgi:hypothetical protein